MPDLIEAFHTALRLIATLDPGLIEIVVLSLQVSLLAVILASLIGFPLGGALAVYLLLSNAGPLGVLQLLYTPTAMIAAQMLLVVPIVGALTRQYCEDLLEEYDEQLRSLGASPREVTATLLWDCRYRLLTVVLAGFGRAIAEGGAVMIVGGNID